MFGWGKKKTRGMRRVVRAAAVAKYRLKFLYTPLPVVPATETDMVLLPQGL